MSDEDLPLKLYQAPHKRHYLVSASLIREEPGLPDCEPALGRREKAAFVLRRLLPPKDEEGTPMATAPLDQWDEYAFVPGARGNIWRRLGAFKSIPPDPAVRRSAPGEEQLPLFPVSFLDNCEDRRRLLSGVIPVSRREDWVGAPVGGDLSPADTVDAPATDDGRSLAGYLLQADVIAPWKHLLEKAEFRKQALARNGGESDADEDAQRLLRSSRDEIQTGSWYLLLDLARFLQRHLPVVWQAIGGEAASVTLDAKEQALVNLLEDTSLSFQLANAVVTYRDLLFFNPFGSPNRTATDRRYNYLQVRWTLAQALVGALAAEEGLERIEATFVRFDEDGKPLPLDADWPGFLFPLADPEWTAPMPGFKAAEITDPPGLTEAQKAVDGLAEAIEALLPPGPGADTLIDRVQAGDPRQSWFVVRCIFQRPGCGPLFPALVSEPTQPFQMAPFFDPDAPARPVRIPMPLDISPAGLRKYQNNVGVVMSDMLCGKIGQVRKMTFGDLVLSVLPWPFHKDLPDPSGGGSCKDDKGLGIGMICSLSIPIVTLCALILLIIIVALFDLFFRWIPYLFICLPIPGLKGKAKA